MSEQERVDKLEREKRELKERFEREKRELERELEVRLHLPPAAHTISPSPLLSVLTTLFSPSLSTPLPFLSALSLTLSSPSLPSNCQPKEEKSRVREDTR